MVPVLSRPILIGKEKKKEGETHTYQVPLTVKYSTALPPLLKTVFIPRTLRFFRFDYYIAKRARPAAPCMYVCMYGHHIEQSMDQPGKVANPARGQLNRENEHSPVPVRA